jgi:hypothetical protein
MLKVGVVGVDERRSPVFVQVWIPYLYKYELCNEPAISAAQTRRLVVRYRFDIVCEGRIYRDEVGCRFGSKEEAFARAAEIERELAADGDAYHGCAVHVFDEQDREVALLQIGPTKI